MKKIQGKSGKWYKVSQFESCCDCGLCHQKEYRVTIKGDKAEIYFRAWRHKKKTAKNRQKKQACQLIRDNEK